MLSARHHCRRAGIESLETRRVFAAVVSQVADLSGMSQGISYTFDSPVSTADVLNSLSVWTEGGAMPRDQLAVAATGTNQVRVTWPGVLTSSVSGMLGNGNYEAILEDGAGSPFSTRSVLPFFYYYGDSNRNRTVDFPDLVAVAQNYNSTGKTNAQGDSNYDHAVDFIDLIILAKNYDRTLVAPGTTSAVSVGAVTNNSVTLTFAPPTDVVTGLASTTFTGFHVYRSSDGVNYTKVSVDNDPNLARNDSTSLYSWTNSGLSAGTSYSYLVSPHFTAVYPGYVTPPNTASGDWYKSNEVSAMTAASAAIAITDKSIRGDQTTRRYSAWSEIA
jgi:hypothetical protein